MERRVIMLAYHFPPENVIGAVRPYLFRKYLSELGYSCHVITAARQSSASHSDTEYIADPFFTSPRLRMGWQIERGLRKFFFPGGLGFQWSRLACRAARNLLDSKQTAETTIYSTFPPIGTHLAALLLTRNTKLKWIADFRDPMYFTLGQPRLSRFRRAAYYACQKSVLKRADAVIVTTDTLADEWKCRYPDREERIHVIWNGFDPDDQIEEYKPPQRSYRLFSHTGALYGGRNITPLLESVSRLIEARRLLPDRLRIRLVGGMNSNCLPSAEFLARATKEGWLDLIAEHLPRSDARRMAQESDGLLLVQPHSRLLVPGKLFEYLRLRRPILAFIPSGSPIERILKSSGATYQSVYVGASRQDFDDAVENFIKHSRACEAPTAWFQENFDARIQTTELARLIQSLHQPVDDQIAAATAKDDRARRLGA